MPFIDLNKNVCSHAHQSGMINDYYEMCNGLDFMKHEVCP